MMVSSSRICSVLSFSVVLLAAQALALPADGPTTSAVVSEVAPPSPSVSLAPINCDEDHIDDAPKALSDCITALKRLTDEHRSDQQIMFVTRFNIPYGQLSGASYSIDDSMELVHGRCTVNIGRLKPTGNDRPTPTTASELLALARRMTDQCFKNKKSRRGVTEFGVPGQSLVGLWMRLERPADPPKKDTPPPESTAEEQQKQPSCGFWCWGKKIAGAAVDHAINSATKPA